MYYIYLQITIDKVVSSVEVVNPKKFKTSKFTSLFLSIS